MFMKQIHKVQLILMILLGIVLQNTLKAQTTCACCSSYHDDFDFWIGAWDVYDEQNNVIAENTISKIENNCIILEEYKTSTGLYSGTSSNFYNADTAQWEQLWLDNQGQHLKLYGGLKNDTMVLTSRKKINKDTGTTFYHEIVWTPINDGSVQQVWTTYYEDSKPKVVFNGLYKRKD